MKSSFAVVSLGAVLALVECGAQAFGGLASLFPSQDNSIYSENDTTYTFNSQSGLVADVQHWLDNPARHAGRAVDA